MLPHYSLPFADNTASTVQYSGVTCRATIKNMLTEKGRDLSIAKLHFVDRFCDIYQICMGMTFLFTQTIDLKMSSTSIFQGSVFESICQSTIWLEALLSIKPQGAIVY